MVEKLHLHEERIHDSLHRMKYNIHPAKNNIGVILPGQITKKMLK